MQYSILLNGLSHPRARTRSAKLSCWISSSPGLLSPEARPGKSCDICVSRARIIFNRCGRRYRTKVPLAILCGQILKILRHGQSAAQTAVKCQQHSWTCVDWTLRSAREVLVGFLGNGQHNTLIVSTLRSCGSSSACCILAKFWSAQVSTGWISSPGPTSLSRKGTSAPANVILLALLIQNTCL